MLRTFVAVTVALFMLVTTTVAADDLPEKIELVLDASSYGFVPVKGKGAEYDLDQPSPRKEFEMTLKRDDRRMAFGDMIPGWRGSEEIVLKDGYRLRVNARYLNGEPRGDFVGEKPGLTLDVSYYYEKQLIGFHTATHWANSKAGMKMTAELKDIQFFDLLSQNEFPLPAVTDGYEEGFRAWVALRDGLGKGQRKNKLTYDMLAEALKPLNRKDNLMIPTVTVMVNVKQPKQAK